MHRPADLIRVFARLHQLAVTCAPAISQHAAIFALRGAADAEKRRYLEELGRRRALAMRCLKEFTDLTCFAPAGAFYIFIDISSKAVRRGPSLDAALSLLAEEKVVAIPGSAFGARGEGYLRISFAAEPEKIEEGSAGSGDSSARAASRSAPVHRAVRFAPVARLLSSYEA